MEPGSYDEFRDEQLAAVGAGAPEIADGVGLRFEWANPRGLAVGAPVEVSHVESPSREARAQRPSAQGPRRP
jgi:hypothetical protein